LPLPTFLVIGAQRAGTTSIALYLAAHPGVFMPARKELHFFDRPLSRNGPPSKLRAYARNFEGAGRDQQIGEATPTYLYVPGAMEAVAEHLPEVRLIATLRNPADRAYSHYWAERFRGREDLDFEDALEAEPARLASGDGQHQRQHSYLDRGRYIRQLERVGRLFPREALLVVIAEELFANPVDVYRQLCRHIGVDDATVPAVVGERFRTGPADKQPGGAPRSVATLVKKRLRRLGAGRPAPKPEKAEFDYPPLDADTRSRVLERFRDDNRALSEWLQRDLPWGP
jgi:hypothetical protein